MARQNAYERKRVAELVEAGLRTVKTYKCKCGADCLRGDDDDRISITATVDIEPIDQFEEMLAVIDGRMTFDIQPAKGKSAKPGTFVLNWRDHWTIAAGKCRYPVLVEHQCRRTTI